jgi:hypothetical protein
MMWMQEKKVMMCAPAHQLKAVRRRNIFVMILSPKTYSIIKYVVVISVLLLTGCSLGFSNRILPTDDTGHRVVDVDPVHQVCELASECVLVYVDCSGCDCGVPVNKKFEIRYHELYEVTCSDYVGAVCEMYCPEPTIVCESGQCRVDPSQ